MDAVKGRRTGTPARGRAALRALLLAACTALLLVRAGAAALVQEAPAERIAALLARLEGAAPGPRAEAVAELVTLGEPAAQAALSGFEARPISERRARARVVREAGGEACVAGAAAASGDPDAAVRRELVLFLGRRLRDARDEKGAEAGFAALARVARDDPESELRAAALDAFARSDHPRAAELLAGLVLELPEPECTQAARGLAGQARARDIVVERVQRALAVAGAEAGPTPASLRPEALAVLLGEGYGVRLAELPQGGTAARDRAPFLCAAVHADAAVRLAARLALDRFFARLRQLGDYERAEQVLERLCAEAPADWGMLGRRASFVLENGRDASGALAAARTLTERALRADAARGASAAEDSVARRAAAIGLLLEGAALMQSDRPAEAEAPVARAAELLDGLRAERHDLRGRAGAMVAESLDELRAVAELYRALGLLQQGAAPDSPEVLEHARLAHRHSLEAQLLATRGPLRRWAEGLDTVFDHSTGPFALVFANRRQRTLAHARVLELERGLCEAMAAVVPREMPGFGAAGGALPGLAPDRVDDLADGETLPYDAERNRLLERIRAGQVEQARREAARAQRDGDQDWFQYLGRIRQVLNRASRLSSRTPSDAALRLAGDLRQEGRAAESRLLAERTLADLERADFSFDAVRGQQMIARTMIAIGGSWTDEDQPERAERALLSALERFEAIERGLGGDPRRESGDPETRLWRAEVLISLAVNANVKLRDPARALGYFERAYELRQDDWMRTLLACYRARAGRAEEARAVLRDTVVTPESYYNRGCTHALLGEPDEALDFLRRAFAEYELTPGALERQKEWARDDPDLRSLRDDPRFQALVR
jgi:tetratricopeptide (TPR) repeat protein